MFQNKTEDGLLNPINAKQVKLAVTQIGNTQQNGASANLRSYKASLSLQKNAWVQSSPKHRLGTGCQEDPERRTEKN